MPQTSDQDPPSPSVPYGEAFVVRMFGQREPILVQLGRPWEPPTVSAHLYAPEGYTDQIPALNPDSQGFQQVPPLPSNPDIPLSFLLKSHIQDNSPYQGPVASLPASPSAVRPLPLPPHLQNRPTNAIIHSMQKQPAGTSRTRLKRIFATIATTLALSALPTANAPTIPSKNATSTHLSMP